MTHVCISRLTIIRSDNCLSPSPLQALIWTSAGIWFIGPPGTNFSEITIKIHTFSFKKIHLKTLSGKWGPSCLCLNVMMYAYVILVQYGVLLSTMKQSNCIILWEMYVVLSSTLPEIDPDTAYVVCISVSLGFRQKPSDTALLSVIALTTFNCIVSASVTKGVLVCFVVTVHWWRHRTHYDVTEAYRVLRNILTIDLNNGATRADLRGIPKHYEATAKAGR